MAQTMNPLLGLNQRGQFVWLDHISRSLIRRGGLQRLHGKQLPLTVTGDARPDCCIPPGPVAGAEALGDDEIHGDAECLGDAEAEDPLRRGVPAPHCAARSQIRIASGEPSRM